VEFSFKVSETEYRRAWTLRTKGESRAGMLRKILFWVFILFCLMLVFAVVQMRSHRQRPVTEQPAATQQSTGKLVQDDNLGLALAINAGPFVLLGVGWFFLFGRLQRSQYRRDPMMQGQFTVNLTATAVSVQNTAGTSSQAGWNAYDYWSEGSGLIVLASRSNSCLILSLAGLSEPQRQELRGILSVALPKK